MPTRRFAGRQMRETIEIGEKSEARVVASHLKANGANYWGSSAAAVSLIQRARDRGVVWADQYPYSTSGTDGSTVLNPAWARRGTGPAAAETLKRVLGDPKSAQQVRSDIAHEIQRRGGADNVVVFDYSEPSLYGLSLDEIARRWQLDPMKDRGLTREGMAADLVVFDLDTIRDKAIFFEPHQHSDGVEYVFVNGVAVVDATKLTGALPGRLLMR